MYLSHRKTATRKYLTISYISYKVGGGEIHIFRSILILKIGERTVKKIPIFWKTKTELSPEANYAVVNAHITIFTLIWKKRTNLPGFTRC